MRSDRWWLVGVGVCCVLSFATAVRAQEIRRAAAQAHDDWSQPNPGVRYLHRTTTIPSDIHAVVVDLTVPGVRIVATPYEQRWQTVNEYASANHVAVAINGGFWGMMQRAAGITAGGGERWPDGDDDAEMGFFAVTRDQRAWISPPEREENEVPAARLSEAASGRPMLLRDGHIDQAALDGFENANLRHPRTAVGVSRDGRKVVLIVADGRQGHSRGMTLYELARMFVELGAYNALNLDGGGSSAMYVASQGGIVNSPSGGRWEARLGLGASREQRNGQRHATKVRMDENGNEEVFVRGIEREVMNHIGVLAPAGGATASGNGRAHGGAAGIAVASHDDVVLQPRRPILHLGRARETIIPIALGALALLPVAGVFLVVYWRRRQRRKRARTTDQTSPGLGGPTDATAPAAFA